MSRTNSLNETTPSTRRTNVSVQTLIDLISELKKIVTEFESYIIKTKGDDSGKREGGDVDGSKGYDDTRKAKDGDTTKKDFYGEGSQRGGGSADSGKREGGDGGGSKGDDDTRKEKGGEDDSTWMKASNCVKHLLTPKRKDSDTTKDKGSEKGGSSAGGSRRGDDSKHTKSSPAEQIVKLKTNLEQIEDSLAKLREYEEDFEKKINAHTERLKDLFSNIRKIKESLPSSPAAAAEEAAPQKPAADDAATEKLREINKEIKKLKHRIPSSSKVPVASADHRDESRKTEETGTEVRLEGLLSLHVSKSFTDSSFYDEIEKAYEGLSREEKNCLLCFSVFSENEELHKRVLMYWWEGEEFLKPDGKERGSKTIEEIAGKILDNLVAKGLIERVYKKRRLIAYKMQPVVRSVIVKIAAGEKFFNYDKGGNLEVKSTKGERACLVKPASKSDIKSSSSKWQGQENTNASKSDKESSSSMSQGQEKTNSSKSDKESSSSKSQGQKNTNTSTSGAKDKDQESRLKTIFNVNEPFPDLRLKWLAKDKGKDKEKSLEAKEWLAKMNALKVLYLGTWRASGKHHIEVDSTDFLEGLNSMSSLRLLSLQGISRINELTKSIRGLVELRILDLKACHNLEELPREISYLKNLTHLDVSDCYMMAHMPKSLSYLTNLQVLKGFVVGDYKNRSGNFCNLEGLVRMKKLTTLTIVISNKDFPNENDLKTLANFEKLKKLTLSWGADPSSDASTGTTSHTPSNATSNEHTSSSLEKVVGMGRSLSMFAKRSKTGNINEHVGGVNDGNTEPKLFKKLEKLDLQCYPRESSPSWLRAEKLASLKKLYIRGGKLGGDLGYSSSSSSTNANNGGLQIKWKSVEMLRLKYMAGVKINWDEMQELFPKLSYLEKVDCPLITMCPCDEDGVWVKHSDDKKPDHVRASDDHQKVSEQAEKADQNKPQQSG